MKCLQTWRMEWRENGLWAIKDAEFGDGELWVFQGISRCYAAQWRRKTVNNINANKNQMFQSNRFLMIYIFGHKVIRSNNIIIKFMTCGCKIRKLSFDLWINMRLATWNIEVHFNVICLENPSRKKGYIVYKRPMKNYYLFFGTNKSLLI